jgi:Family of unknown function (DUF6529)
LRADRDESNIAVDDMQPPGGRMTTAGARRRDTGGRAAAIALCVGAIVSIGLGVYGKQHHPTGEPITTFGFGTMSAMKVWLGLTVAVLAVVQILLALWMYGKFGRPAPSWVGPAHRIVGSVAIIVSLPVAFHCLWALGFQSFDTRVLIHSLAGCILYGAFVAKVLGLHSGHTPAWTIPLLGGLLFAAIVAVTFTGAVWYLDNFGIPDTSNYGG